MKKQSLCNLLQFSIGIRSIYSSKSKHEITQNFLISYNVECDTRLMISGLECLLTKAPDVRAMVVQDVVFGIGFTGFIKKTITNLTFEFCITSSKPKKSGIDPSRIAYHSLLW